MRGARRHVRPPSERRAPGWLGHVRLFGAASSALDRLDGCRAPRRARSCVHASRRASYRRSRDRCLAVAQLCPRGVSRRCARACAAGGPRARPGARLAPQDPPAASGCDVGPITNFLAADATQAGVISLIFFGAQGTPVEFFECVDDTLTPLGTLGGAPDERHRAARRHDVGLRAPVAQFRRARHAARRHARRRRLQRAHGLLREPLRGSRRRAASRRARSPARGSSTAGGSAT